MAERLRRASVLQIGKFYPPYRGGMETHLQALCREIRDAVDLSVLVANDSPRTVRERVDGVDVTRLGSLGTLRSTTICPGMPRAIRGRSPDLVHLHWPNPSAALSLLLSGYRGRLVATYHSDVVRQRFLGAMFDPILDRFLRRCSAIICTSPDYMGSSRVLARHRDRCRVLPFSIAASPLERFDPVAVAAIRDRYGPRMVLAAGRLVSYKGFIHLLRAMTHVDGRLVLVGSGPLHDALLRERRLLSLESKVTVLGEVPDLVPYYHACDVFVLPSVTRAEAFGLVQLEAMACGKPVVNTALGTGTTYVSPHGVTGITVPPADPHALAAAISRLLDSPALAQRLGAGGRLRFAELFTLERMGRETLALYEEVLRPGDTAP